MPVKHGFSGKKATGQTFNHFCNEKIFSNLTGKENLSNQCFNVLLKIFLACSGDDWGGCIAFSKK